MTYIDQWHLTYDDPFTSRCRACLNQQAMTFKDDGRADIAALARDILKGSSGAVVSTFMTMLGTTPGLAAAVHTASERIDSTQITDQQILSAVQSGWPVIAGLLYNADGTPK